MNQEHTTHLIFPLRSDGKEEIVTNRKKETNAPTTAQLDSRPKPDGSRDYYREIKYDDAKHYDWRRKLGRMMMKYGGGSKELEDAPAVLEWLPQGYRLYEHVKIRPTGDKEKDKKGNHAGGGDEIERQDAYLYGHPLGRRKRYRSPADFFPHLKWLFTDKIGDYDNCACKICAPDDIQPPKTVTVPVEAKSIESPSVGKVQPSVVVKQEAPSRPPSAPRTVTPTAPPLTPSQTPSNAFVAVANPQAPLNVDKKVDLQAYSPFIFRQGEQVWFPNPDGRTYGLGVVIRRWVQAAQSNEHAPIPTYTVQPFSSPLSSRAPVTFANDFALRPWLALMPPKFSATYLNQSTVSYHQLTHADFEKGLFNSPSIETDASVLIAKTVDNYGTPFHKTFETTETQGQNTIATRHYAGMFVGAEKLWVGDVARFHSDKPADLFLITNIVERQLLSGQPNQAANANLGIKLAGNVYTYASADPRNMPPLDPYEELPARLVQDLRFRHSIVSRGGRAAGVYKPAQRSEVLDPIKLKGRWYEPTRIIHHVDPNHWQNFAAGSLDDSALLHRPVMLSRGCPPNKQEPLGPMVWHSNGWTREADFARAVPPSTRFWEGIDPPEQIRQEMMPFSAAEGAHQSHQPHHTHQTNPAPATHQDHGNVMEDFMNWTGEGEEDPMAGFTLDQGATGGGGGGHGGDMHGQPYY